MLTLEGIGRVSRGVRAERVMTGCSTASRPPTGHVRTRAALLAGMPIACYSAREPRGRVDPRRR